MTTQLVKWTVDACPDANGYWTIRPADGTEHGDTDEQPIATVYEEDHADLAAKAPELLAILKTVLAKMPFGANWDGKGNNPAWLKEARAIISDLKAVSQQPRSGPQLTANEVRLIGLVLAQDNSTLDPTTIKRRSFREFDVEFGGRGGRLKCGYSAWLVLAAIRELTAWTNPELALMTDYPTMAVSGDWSGVRDTIPTKLWAILEKHVLPLLK